MSKRILVFRRQLQELQKQGIERNEDIGVIIDFSRSCEDTMSLTGFPKFLETIRKLEPDTEDWKWSEDAICKACEQVGMSRRSIILRDTPNENIVIQINKPWR